MPSARAGYDQASHGVAACTHREQGLCQRQLLVVEGPGVEQQALVGGHWVQLQQGGAQARGLAQVGGGGRGGGGLLGGRGGEEVRALVWGGGGQGVCVCVCISPELQAPKPRTFRRVTEFWGGPTPHHSRENVAPTPQPRKHGSVITTQCLGEKTYLEQSN